MNDMTHHYVRPIARVVIKHNDSVLIVRRSPHETRAGEWEVPGGSVDPGENFEQAAIREVLEETGLKVDSLSFISSEAYLVSDSHRISLVFSAEVSSDQVILSDEHDDFVWIDEGNFNNYEYDDHYTDFFNDLFSTDVNSTKKVENKTTNYTYVKAYSDGGSRGNPGPSASGYVIMDEHEQILREGGEYLGVTTNNQAEYQAVRTALEECLDVGAQEVDFFVDSMLVVKQLSGEWQIKNRDLWPVHEKIKELVEQFTSVRFTHVTRDKNTLADGKVNEVLDNHTT